MSAAFLITGTDTGVGKTWATCRLAIALRRRGYRVRLLKPVVTGTPTGEVPDDTRLLCEAGGESPEMVTGWSLVEPAAPPVAAEAEGRTLDLGEISRWIAERQLADGVTLVEGAGGLYCPLTRTSTFADLAIARNLPLVVVAARRLGTINHTLLTLEAAHRRGLSVALLLISETRPSEGLAQRTAPDEIFARCRSWFPELPPPVVLPYADPAVAEQLLSAIDWPELLAGFDFPR